MWGWNARNKGGSTRTIAAEEYRKSVAREAAPRRRLSKARRKLMSKLSRFLSTSPTSIEILIADDNPETRGPLAELIEATAMANPNLPPIPLVVYQTDLKSDILAAMNHARISIAIVSESLLDDFQAQLMTELPSDSSSTVFVAYSSNPAGPVFGACCRPPPTHTLPAASTGMHALFFYLIGCSRCIPLLPLLPRRRCSRAARRPRLAVQVLRRAGPDPLAADARVAPLPAAQVDAARRHLHRPHPSHGSGQVGRSVACTEPLPSSDVAVLDE